MNFLDIFILIATIFGLVAYGFYKTRNKQNLQSFLLSGKEMPWYRVGFSVMATQASAITFLSAPGQGFFHGMSFVQFYLGLPLAMIVICMVFIPEFKNANVYTAYEYLEKRFDSKTRLITALLFLIQRGLSTGITIYAPSIVLSAILQIRIEYTILIIGLAVISYTYYGGSSAVSYTQTLQMFIIFSALIYTFIIVIKLLPNDFGLIKALEFAGKANKTNSFSSEIDLNNKYNLFSGLIGGFFLQLSYFGTDQSQVGRYLTGINNNESRWGLILNGFLKIPMQFFILLTGVMVFVFYQFNSSPINFNETALTKYKLEYSSEYQKYEAEILSIQKEKALVIEQWDNNKDSKDQLNTILEKERVCRNAINEKLNKTVTAEKNDENHVFLYFVTHHFPIGSIGVIIAVIFLAAMGSTAGGIHSLASTTSTDIYKRFLIKNKSDESHYTVSKLSTLAWGIFCIGFAFYAAQLGNLIEAVNILGSLFYGTILGIFLVAFYFKRVQGNAVFYAALLSEIITFIIWLNDGISFLWLNVLGVIFTVFFSMFFQFAMNRKIKIYNKILN